MSAAVKRALFWIIFNTLFFGFNVGCFASRVRTGTANEGSLFFVLIGLFAFVLALVVNIAAIEADRS